MANTTRVEFDLACGETYFSPYFKSSFARSVAEGSDNQSKSLDFSYFNSTLSRKESVIFKENYPKESHLRPNSANGCQNLSAALIRKESTYPKGKPFGKNSEDKVKQCQVVDKSARPSIDHDRTEDVTVIAADNTNNMYSTSRPQVLQQEKSRGVPPGGGGGGGGGSQSSRCSSSTSSAGRGMISADPLVDGMWLQSQVDTLQWQLRQAESSRHMYRAVLSQVVRFLERAHTSLDAMQKKAVNASKSHTESGCRVPRSRSVHTVNASASRPASGDRETLGVQRAKSVTLIGADAVGPITASREYTWRRPRSRLEPEELPPEKLSQEAFRLLRTVNSLLNTREPDLSHRITSPPASPSPSPSPSLAHDTTPLLSSTPTPTLSTTASEEDSAIVFRRKLQLSTPTRPYATLPRRLPPPPPPPHTPQPSVSSAEDESGFSSLGSFQEVGVPILSSTVTSSNGSFHEVGLPRADSSQPVAIPPLPPHRRWSSSLPMPPPLCSPVKSGEALRVLWV